MIKAAGLTDVTFLTKPYNVDVMDQLNDPLYKAVRDELPKGKKLSDYVVALDVVAFKPR